MNLPRRLHLFGGADALLAAPYEISANSPKLRICLRIRGTGQGGPRRGCWQGLRSANSRDARAPKSVGAAPMRRSSPLASARRRRPLRRADGMSCRLAAQLPLQFLDLVLEAG